MRICDFNVFTRYPKIYVRPHHPKSIWVYLGEPSASSSTLLSAWRGWKHWKVSQKPKSEEREHPNYSSSPRATLKFQLQADWYFMICLIISSYPKKALFHLSSLSFEQASLPRKRRFHHGRNTLFRHRSSNPPRWLVQTTTPFKVLRSPTCFHTGCDNQVVYMVKMKASTHQTGESDLDMSWMPEKTCLGEKIRKPPEIPVAHLKQLSLWVLGSYQEGNWGWGQVDTSLSTSRFVKNCNSKCPKFYVWERNAGCLDLDPFLSFGDVHAKNLLEHWNDLTSLSCTSFFVELIQ